MSNKIFMWCFIVLGSTSLIGAISGATHQLGITVICGIMAATFYAHIKPLKNERRNSLPR